MFGLTTKINGFILTRDSAIWLWGRIVGLGALVGAVMADPGFGALDVTSVISSAHLHQIQVAAAIVSLVSAQMSNSKLPSKADADKVTLPVKE